MPIPVTTEEAQQQYEELQSEIAEDQDEQDKNE